MLKLRKLFAFGALACALVAALLSTQRHLLLKVPKIGFILHAMAGGPVPPYMEPSIFDRDSEWLKSGDVILSVPAKSGTTWLMYTVNLLRAKGRLPASFRDVYEEVPWAEFVYYPGQTVDERIQHINNVSSRYPFGIFKTHVAPPTLPMRDDVKYIVSFRDLFDAAASSRPFFNNHQAGFAKLWGGFPPNAGEPNLGPEQEWERMLLEDGGNGVPMVKTFFFDMLNSWWPLRNRSNVLLVHYSDRLKEDVTQLKRISNFLGLGLSDTELSSIATQVSYSEMKKVETAVELRYVLNQYKARGLIPEDVFLLNEKKGSNMMNKGGSRKGRQELSQHLREGLDSLAKTSLSPDAWEWVMKGGAIPQDSNK